MCTGLAAGAEAAESPPPSALDGSLGVFSQILPAVCLPRLAKATEGKINHEEGLLELCWKAGTSHALCVGFICTIS